MAAPHVSSINLSAPMRPCPMPLNETAYAFPRRSLSLICILYRWRVDGG